MDASKLVEKLKRESKKNITNISGKSKVTYDVENVEIFGDRFLMKSVKVKPEFSGGYDVGWIMNNQTKSCMRCNNSFGYFTWKHHCRKCGYIVCSLCNSKRLQISALKESNNGSKACQECYYVNKISTYNISKYPGIKNMKEESINDEKERTCKQSSSSPQVQSKPRSRTDSDKEKTIIEKYTDTTEPQNEAKKLDISRNTVNAYEHNLSRHSRFQNDDMNLSQQNTLNLSCETPEHVTKSRPKYHSDQEKENYDPSYTNIQEISQEIEKMGTPITRKIILHEAMNNGIWEASDNDSTPDGRTSASDTPSSVSSMPSHPKMQQGISSKSLRTAEAIRIDENESLRSPLFVLNRATNSLNPYQ